MEKILLLDSNSLVNRAFYAMPNFSNRQGQFTGAIFGYLKMLIKLIETYKPTYVVATFDRRAPTFRKKIYENYKAQRSPMPQELASQLEPLKEIIRAMNIPILEMDGYEADDIIGTIAKKYKNHTLIVTGDKDSLQLIDDTTTVLLTRKGVSEIETYDLAHLKEEGLVPSQIIDLKSLMGDTSDNIPGVPGVGEKTARTLLEKYKTLDGVYENIDDIKGKLKEKIEQNKELAYLSYELATININSPIEFNLESARLKMPFDFEVRDLLRKLELNKIVEKLEFDGVKTIIEEKVDIIEINDISQLEQVKKAIEKEKQFSINIDFDAEIAVNKNKSFIIRLSQDLFGGLFIDNLLEELKEFFQSEDIKKYAYDIKSLKHLLSRYHIEVSNNFEDILLMAYLSDANRNYKSLDDLINSYNIESPSKAASVFNIYELAQIELRDNSLKKLYNDMEKPLIEVLFDMEKEGFSVDKNKVLEINTKIKAELDIIKEEIYLQAGEVFNINSTKQLAAILFDKLGLAASKKTKTGRSTNIEVLQNLYDAHPIIPVLIRYRELEKLRSTYLDGMLPLIESDGKIHTIFKQTVTATGRLSSTEPNLQNIPVRREEGKVCRAMFVASKGRKLICADYSQIELRLMAAFSKDQSMIKAFNEGKDIHAITASQVLNLPLESITPKLRSQAKAVNFGIIYGISDFGLAQDLGITVHQARDFIQSYFATYPTVRSYMEKLKNDAKSNSYAKTMMGRIRYIPELTMSSYTMRQLGERVAMNMPLQGSASDIIKLAMIKVFKSLKQANLKSKLIMQVHDELIVDTYEDEIDQVKTILKDCMENIVELPVKLEVEVGVGNNWLEAK